MIEQKKGRHYWQFISLLIVVVILSCVLVGSLIAWLQKEYLRMSDGVRLGEVKLELYADNTLVSGTTSPHTTDNGETWECTNPYIVPTSSTTTRTLNLKVRNTGTIDALLRATIRVYSGESTQALLSSIPTVLGNGAISISMNTPDWIHNFPAENTIASGNMYLNKLISPYVVNGETKTENEISIITTIVVPDGYENNELKVSVTLDAVAYSGNIYKKINQLKPENVTTGTTETLNGDTREYYIFTSPEDTEFTEEIPVKAFPYGLTLPKNWEIWK